MPAKSQKQLRAMFAAAEGKSTLGIPKKVGAEFVQATAKPGALPVKAPSAPKKPRQSKPALSGAQRLNVSQGKMAMPGDEALPAQHTSKHH